MALTKKKCKSEGCSAYAWSGGYCASHGKKKTPLKRRGKSIKRKVLMSDMVELFEVHWDTHKDRCCESCGVQLYSNNLCYHDHLLPKSKYPELTLEIDNLFLCCMSCHNKKEMGFPTEKHNEAINNAKIKFLDEV